MGTRRYNDYEKTIVINTLTCGQTHSSIDEYTNDAVLQIIKTELINNIYEIYKNIKIYILH